MISFEIERPGPPLESKLYFAAVLFQQSYNNTMFKSSTICLITFFFLVLLPEICSEQVCWGEQCTFDAKKNESPEALLRQAVQITDLEIKRIYWYYLRNADTIYQGNVVAPENYIQFFIYRNFIGTFLAIGTWDYATQVATLTKFIRLGDGYSRDLDAPDGPVKIEPYIIQLKLEYGEALVQLDDNNKTVCSEPEICEQEQFQLESEVVEKGCELMDQQIRQEYWYYLEQGTIITYKDTITTTQRIYALTVYVSALGTYLTISTCDYEYVTQINTFVRLGAGSQNPREVAPVAIGRQTDIITAA